jgi:hypothetical protein
MACSKCKKKEMYKELESQVNSVSKWVIIVLISLTVSAVYGIYTFISNLM